MHKIHGISLGPGDPELITIKGLRILKESDVIFYPGSLLSDGRKESYVLPILKHYGLEESRLQGFFLKMSTNRSKAEETYTETALEVFKAFQQGKKISIVCEGDLSFYASFSYLLEKLHRYSMPVELVPGINSFSLGAAKHQVPLCLQNQKVTILPREESIESIEQALQHHDTLILMKIRSGWNSLREHLLNKNWSYYYCERLGTEKEFITSDISALQDREIPYFSLLIIKR
ncbi:precorrin-2 C(20)-methyltransferase [Pontibacter diazotrophicus]|uniref:Precorrin-2 C(20)-methyltransferase n=1 Tax=Pontibacter diazotrophicus TaxID=1400979 RepID=A0A3D8L1P0_9BACT|nr:precorrin-2 C(20)-methyltransferase [Pontibacter diazotrophicus]RDV11341.1 precorrin-2 C(20)-methyltransferase [Pontibacter diazotrophicus]